MSLNSKKFRTKQEFLWNETHPKGKDYITGLDLGYSGVKGFFENGRFCFPSYVRKLDHELLNVSDRDILYKDLDTNELYIVGYSAQNMITSVETNDTDGEMYSRKRYNNPKFKILCNVALAILTMNKKDDRPVVIQTGLPTAYVEGDSPALRKTLAKPAHFAVKIGTDKWRSFELSLDDKNIFIMPQPAGSLYSVLIKNDGKYASNATDILNQNTIVLDGGFGTFDFYGIINRAISCRESIDDIGMRKILEHTSKLIADEYGESIRAASLQKNLETGKIRCIDEDTLSTDEKPIAPLLESASEEVFKEAMTKIRSVTNTFRDYDNVIVSGGTGDAWFDMTKEYLKNMSHLTIIPGNINDQPNPFLYANVRGYYMFLYMRNKR